jgi:hypothetical protein
VGMHPTAISQTIKYAKNPFVQAFRMMDLLLSLKVNKVGDVTLTPPTQAGGPAQIRHESPFRSIWSAKSLLQFAKDKPRILCGNSRGKR